MNLRQTSLDAHNIIQGDGTATNQRMRILEFVRKYAYGLTRNEISGLLGIRINAVCGRVRELIKLGSLREDGKKVDKYSNKENFVLKANQIKEYTEGG